MADIKWIKLKTAMFNDDKIKVIQAMPEGDSLIVIWIRMLILAGVSNAEGYLMISDNLPYTEEMLSTVFNKPLSVIRLAIKTFETFGMIEANNEGIFIQNFSESQSERLPDIREYNRMKKAESRERAKQKRLGLSNRDAFDSQEKSSDSQGCVNDMSMTSQGQMSICQSIDIDIDKDIEKDINNIPRNQVDFGDGQAKLDFGRISALYNAACKDLPKVRGVSEERRRKVKTLLNALDKAKVLMELGPYERLEYIFRLADESDFLSGRMPPNTWCGFDWLINSKNALKVIEGNYKNKPADGGSRNGGDVCHGRTRGCQPADAGFTSESENDALEAFRRNRCARDQPGRPEV